MADDPYQILGVSKDASDGDIRKAYRKLAKDLHPDLNPGDKTAEERFKKVSAAYNLLKDPDLRARYDRGEIDASGAERVQQPFYRGFADADGGDRYASAAGFQDFEDLSDLFSDLFARRGAAKARGADMRFHLEVDFLDAARGSKQRITLPGGGTLDLTIPPGSQDGQTLRLKGKGRPGLGGGPPGDAYIEITVRPHAIFRREGDDIVMELPITLDEAVLGAKIEVPTVSGRVNMSVPRGANTGDTLRLRGKGVAPAGRPTGDQRVTLKIMMPPTVDSDLETFIRTWRETHRYDPRAQMGKTS